MTEIRIAMVLAAGRGMRMRPITDRIPKPLIEVNGHSMLDRALDALDAFGIGRVVVNASYLAEFVGTCLAARRRPSTVLSREEERLETGGGIRNALPLLGNEPFLVVNSDVVVPGAEVAYAALAEAWDETRMDALLLLVPRERATGYSGSGDFRIATADGKSGQLERSSSPSDLPLVFSGLQILNPHLFDEAPDGAFPLGVLYARAREQDRLHGIVHEGPWLHVGTPAGLAEAEAVLRSLESEAS